MCLCPAIYGSLACDWGLDQIIVTNKTKDEKCSRRISKFRNCHTVGKQAWLLVATPPQFEPQYQPWFIAQEDTCGNDYDPCNAEQYDQHRAHQMSAHLLDSYNDIISSTMSNLMTYDDKHFAMSCMSILQECAESFASRKASGTIRAIGPRDFTSTILSIFL